jgi:hypothetical protein
MDTALQDELLALKKRDLDMRAQLVREGRLYDGYAEEMQLVHRENAQRLDELVARHGWPTTAKAGLEGSRAAWMVAQHSICTPALQRKFLALVSQAADSGEVPKLQAALLTDRIRFNEDKPQVYGTVLDWDEHGNLSSLVEDPANVDARRKAVGLPLAHEEDLAMRRREVEAEGGRPPADFEAARQKKLAWAKSVGWL